MWISILFAIGFGFILQQSAFARNTSHPLFLAEKVRITPTEIDVFVTVPATPIPTDILIPTTTLTPTLSIDTIITVSSIDTGTPSITPVSSPSGKLNPTPTLPGNQQSQQQVTSSTTPTPTLPQKRTVLDQTLGFFFPTSIPTSKPRVIPTSTPILQKKVDSSTNTNTSSSSNSAPPPTLPPGVTPTITPPIPLPTEPPSPSTSDSSSQPVISDLGSLATGAVKKNNVTTTTLDTKTLAPGGISVVPEEYIPENNVPERPLLPQEINSSTNVPTARGGILITLEKKTGDALVTRQNELTVKRGNQFFTISNQPKSVTTKKEQGGVASLIQENLAPPSNTTPTTSSQLEINANNVIARSSMGISIDPLSGVLTVNTPNGPQRVSIMPDEALGIVVELKAINAKGAIEPSMTLVSENGSLLYRITGSKVQKILGLFPLPIQKQVLVSADTGSIIKVELSLLSQILNLFTF